MYYKFKFFIFSENPDKLLPFYRDVLGFPVINELKLPLNYGYMVEVCPGYEIWIAQHSEVKGYNKDKFRHILTLYPGNIDEVFEKIKDYPGVTIVEAPVSMSKFNPAIINRRMFTMLDPEGNCLQFYESKK